MNLTKKVVDMKPITIYSLIICTIFIITAVYFLFVAVNLSLQGRVLSLGVIIFICGLLIRQAGNTVRTLIAADMIEK